MNLIQVTQNAIQTISYDGITSGTVGAKFQVNFGESWQDYNKTVVFQYNCNCATPIPVLVGTAQNIEIVVPPEVVAHSGSFIIGVYGTLEDTVLPTLWSDNFNVSYGTTTNIPGTPSPSIVEQLMKKIDKNSDDIAENSREIVAQGHDIEDNTIAININAQLIADVQGKLSYILNIGNSSHSYEGNPIPKLTNEQVADLVERSGLYQEKGIPCLLLWYNPIEDESYQFELNQIQGISISILYNNMQISYTRNAGEETDDADYLVTKFGGDVTSVNGRVGDVVGLAEKQYVDAKIGDFTELLEYGSDVSEILKYIIGQITPPPQDEVDIFVFMGQSNMSGRGEAEDAPIVPQGQGFWYKNQNMLGQSQADEGLYDIVEPFGNEGATSSGSMVAAFVNEYYTLTQRPVVAISNSIGGTSIAQWVGGTGYATRSLSYLADCKTYLASIGKTVRHTYALWCQGESDTETQERTEAYIGYFIDLTDMLFPTFDKMFVINIGQTNDGSYDFTAMRSNIESICSGDDNVVLVSDKFRNATAYMKDRWHYHQFAYNTVGKNSAQNIVKYIDGDALDIKIFNAQDEVDEPITEWGTLEDWDYTLVNTTVVLNSYIGTNPNVRVYKYYKIDDLFYKAQLRKRAGTSATDGTFYNNTVIENLVIDDDVLIGNATGKTDGDNQSGLSAFSGMTNLQTLVGNPPMTISQEAFNNTTMLTSDVDLSKMHGSFDKAFYHSSANASGDITNCTIMRDAFNGNTTITNIGNISGAITNFQRAFQGCANLQTVGEIFSSSTNCAFTYMFDGCVNLRGTIRVNANSTGAWSNAFRNCDLSAITIEVPEGSNTYTKILEAYPTANVTTF